MSEIDKTLIKESFKKSEERLKNSIPVLQKGLSINNLMPKLKCKWKFSAYDNFNDEFDYETQCDNIFSHKIPIKELSDYKFCHGCGKPIEVIND